MNEREEVNIYELERAVNEEITEAFKRTYEKRYGKKEHKEPNWKDFDLFIKNRLSSSTTSESTKKLYSSFYNETLSNVSSSVKTKIMNYLNKIADKSEYGFFKPNEEYKTYTFIYNLEQLIKNNLNSTVVVDIAFMEAVKRHTIKNDTFINLVNSKKLKDANLTDAFLTALLNSPEFNDTYSSLISYLFNVINEDNFYFNNLNIEFANYYLACPTLKHIKTINAVLTESPSTLESEFILDFLDEIINTEEENLDDLIFHIKNRSVVKEITFAEACKNYNDQAMVILKENNGNISPDTMVKVTAYESEIPKFPMPKFGYGAYSFLKEDTPTRKYSKLF